ncbi:hypothetical protein CHELA1G11_21202 [Hyphomicrobiales bacterium]|nr:hypothetical protein CHELA1G11_21202 [Hyphomicrobiales bacterium]CAH1693732.1 hypothetical protein CHELA1G2_21509 [Hyphomicrobiales bacterium]
MGYVADVIGHHQTIFAELARLMRQTLPASRCDAFLGRELPALVPESAQDTGSDANALG